MEDLAAAMRDLAASVNGVKTTVDDSQSILKELVAWKPQLDGALQEMRGDINTLRQQLGRVALNPILSLDPATLQARATPAAREGGASEMVNSDGGHGPVGHHEFHQHRGLSNGENLALATPPAKGTLLDTDPFAESSGFLHRGGSSSSGNHAPRPKMDFPAFAGERPKSWKRQCESYFRVFNISPEDWVDTATMHFMGSALLWIENCGLDVEKLTWSELCALVCDQFGRDEFQKLLRQLFHLKQSGSVAEYVQEFMEVMHALRAHSRAWDPELFPSRFVDGLKDEIKVVVLVHQPKNLDAAVSLALLQEEAWEIWKKRDPRRQEFPAYTKARYRSTPSSSGLTDRASATPSTPSSTFSTPRSSAMTEDKRGQEAARETTPARGEDRTAALKSYRWSRGLCFICGEKWAPGHKCSTTVQLHVVQEMLDAMGLDPMEETQDQMPATGELLAISQAAIAGTESPNTFRLVVQLQKKKVLMLVDSGSSHCFVNEAVAAALQGTERALQPIQVKIANGGRLTCTRELVGCEWRCQGTTFRSNLKVLPLGGYDVIIGMDWLQSHNPMGVDWVGKRLAFWDQGKLVMLEGVQTPIGTCKEVEPRVLKNMLQQAAVAKVIEIQVLEGEGSEKLAIPEEIERVLKEFSGVFTEPDDLPPARQFDHAIPLMPGAKPVNVRPYRYSPAQKDEIEAQIQKMLKQGIIRPSCSPFASPVLLVMKKDLTWRFCIDYRHLNSITIKNRYPLPIIEELIDELAGARWFTSLDLRAGYHQIRMRPEDEEKTAFKTHNGHFEFRVMSFGLTGAPTTFQNTMNTILAPLLRKGVLVFLDDILVYSRTLEEHTQLLRQVFTLLDQHQLKVKRSKCTFAQQQLGYLGHVISAGGVATDPKNIAAVQKWPTPNTVKEVKGFLGLAGYYQKFVRNFGQISRPLTNLLKKDSVFQWTDQTESAFRQLQHALVTAPVLAIPDFSKPFAIETDASDGGIGAILSQEGHPISYLSRALGPRNQGLSAYEKEFLAILLAVDHWHQYLQVQEFVIQSDHRSLASFDEQRLHTPWQRKALTKLLGLRYKIVYKPGKENGAADALSRRGEQAEVSAISICVPSWLTQVLQGYETDLEVQDLLKKIANREDSVQAFSVQNGLIYKEGRIWLGSNSSLQHTILRSVHDSSIGGHSGVQATYQRLRRNFAWKGMKKAVEEYVELCSVCKQAKSERVRYPGLLQPLPFGCRAWQTITLDFIEGLPLSKNSNCIMVVVDKLTRYAHFVALSHPFTAKQVAIAFVDNIFKLHSLPEIMVSDRDPIFTSKLWKELFQLVGTELAMSSSRHPQTDGQTERVNQCLETYLRCFVNSCPRQWRHWLPLAEFWYNTSFHSAIQTSPFEALYGHPPRHFGIINTTVVARVGEVSYKLKLPEKALIHPVVHVSLLRRAHPPEDEAQVRLPPETTQDEATSAADAPLQILQRRQYLRGSTVRNQVLIQWSSMPELLATWEDEAQLRARFPQAPAWGQAGIERRGNVTTVTTGRARRAAARRAARDAAAARAGPPSESEDAEEENITPQEPGRPRRLRKPSTRLDPKDWVLK